MFVLRVLGALLSFVLALALLLWGGLPSVLAVTLSALLIIATLVQLWLIRADLRSSLMAAYSGVLETSSTKGAMPKLEMGDSGSILVFAGPQGQALMRFFNDCHVTIEIRQNRITRRGRLLLSTLVRNAQGGLIAEIIRNEWQVNPAASFDRNYRHDALEVKDASGDVILQARLMGDRVQLQAKFRDVHGQGVAIGKGQEANGVVGGIIEITGHAHPQLLMHIKPIFRYPSSRYFGKLV
jgi:hypothetical protein